MQRPPERSTASTTGCTHSSTACTAATAASAAVSVRRMRGPSFSAVQPARKAACSSASLSPPSGPASSQAAVGAGNSARRALPSGDSISRASGKLADSANQASRLRMGRSSGTVLRPHCSQAERMMSRQRARRLSARSPLSRTMLRWVASGWNTLTPISTPFCKVKSMRSPLEIPCASPSRNGDSRETASAASSCTRTSRLPTAKIRAGYSRSGGEPLNTVRASPAFRRSTCTWRTTASGRLSSVPAISG